MIAERVSKTSRSVKIAKKVREVREYTLGEEIANSVSHGVGGLLSIAAIPLICVVAIGHGGGMSLFAGLVFGISMLLEYIMSTLYHALAVPKAKKVFKVLDHSFIYLFIAGTYTPFCLLTLVEAGGMWLCIAIWALAFTGVAVEAFWVFRPRWLSALLYLVLGWCVAWFIPALIELLPATGLYLLLAGGICYTVGCIFYVLKKVKFMHSVFHLWVLAGTILHFLAIVLFVL